MDNWGAWGGVLCKGIDNCGGGGGGYKFVSSWNCENLGGYIFCCWGWDNDASHKSRRENAVDLLFSSKAGDGTDFGGW